MAEVVGRGWQGRGQYKRGTGNGKGKEDGERQRFAVATSKPTTRECFNVLDPLISLTLRAPECLCVFFVVD